jgi:hypothetical protein
MTEILIYGIVGDSYDGLDAKTLVPLISEGERRHGRPHQQPWRLRHGGAGDLQRLRRAKAAGRKVTMHIDGLAASMASVIAMAGDEILMADNALMMIHNPWDVAMGDAASCAALPTSSTRSATRWSRSTAPRPA